MKPPEILMRSPPMILEPSEFNLPKIVLGSPPGTKDTPSSNYISIGPISPTTERLQQLTQGTSFDTSHSRERIGKPSLIKLQAPKSKQRLANLSPQQIDHNDIFMSSRLSPYSFVQHLQTPQLQSFQSNKQPYSPTPLTMIKKESSKNGNLLLHVPNTDVSYQYTQRDLALNQLTQNYIYRMNVRNQTLNNTFDILPNIQKSTLPHGSPPPRITSDISDQLNSTFQGGMLTPSIGGGSIQHVLMKENSPSTTTAARGKKMTGKLFKWKKMSLDPESTASSALDQRQMLQRVVMANGKMRKPQQRALEPLAGANC
ncbi:hypothetical protein FGO68_gene13756 [Halteria grandinella]|uniref:Uncharacterized protein n=1 Tax=Halteria grandinella TaxID=5974 RepID=A0A8J8P1U6_HALGN|nr:hypothetical protein FGO68_gene13756 [Halteria grandinella]